ncbi:GTP cyclohydrolase I FolE2 [Clostridium sp. D2Q-14]|uniref:GTP cyclohydrolase FolE2 n=1 Tax=Anaeromonas gelatinilytica TaxID=2683194 RepID=UPI00193C1398|nr:GTP cyclohydrolase FolE2 [Anaeromonas gelatinilytica]MBS4536529.1 GTP cyclohydrolase I FolE2 [Anaeromonas gelatinilytica]
MKDVQEQKDYRNVYLNEVGIKKLNFFIDIKKKDGTWETTKAVIGMSVDLDESQKGTHMSRFVDVIQDNNRLDFNNMDNTLKIIRDRLEAKNSYINLKFDYFIQKEAPVSKKISYLDVGVDYKAWLKDDNFISEMTVNIPITTLCPCSKEISNYSAHNQRANVALTIRTDKFIWIEDLVKIAEESSSSPIYAMLKRPDEKYVTEYAFDHPKFVEDVCRDVKLKLDKFKNIKNYEVEVESYESIHNHSAYAKVIY